MKLINFKIEPCFFFSLVMHEHMFDETKPWWVELKMSYLGIKIGSVDEKKIKKKWLRPRNSHWRD